MREKFDVFLKEVRAYCDSQAVCDSCDIGDYCYKFSDGNGEFKVEEAKSE